MKVGWLADNPGYLGGAEMTQAEFKAAAPEGVKVYDCPPGAVVPGLDRYVIHNCVHYSMADMEAMGDARATKYVHDLWPHGQEDVREWVLDHTALIFCSPLHRRKFRHSIPDWAVTKTIPPALDLDRFRPNRQTRRNGNRSGACCIAQWRNPGKGAQLLGEWADANESVNVFGDGEYPPEGPTLSYRGAIDPGMVPQILWAHRTFVFLPYDLEPFGRAVAEAWAAGCEVVTNHRVGATHYIEQDPDALQTAASDFWEVVTCA